VQDELDQADGDYKGLISGGMGRIVKRLDASKLTKAGAGKSDTSFILRFTAAEQDNFADLEKKETKITPGNVDHAKLARERLAKLNAQLAKETPDWLRDFIKVLPTNRRMNARPSVEMTELVLTALLSNDLPPEPPEEERKGGDDDDDEVNGGRAAGGRKRRRDDEEEEEELGAGTKLGGVAGLFRSRQRAKLSQM